MASSAGAGSKSKDCEDEDPEDPSSSNQNTETDLGPDLQTLNINDNEETAPEEDELSIFREQWRRELDSTTSSPHHELSPAPAPTPAPMPNEDQINEEETAKKLFLCGAELEQSGQLYEAIQHYKRAMQILPDVETRLYEAEKLRDESPEVEEVEEVSNVERNSSSDDEDVVEGEDLQARFQRALARKGALCQQRFESKETHFSGLPYEVILYILRWVVSSELDFVSLERVSAVCRGLFVASREPDLWRAICVRTWGIDCGTPRSLGFGSWRDMFHQRPRLLLNGCYISKTTYVRHGENCFQDHFYRPWYLVVYYRYLRFFSDGVVLMCTSPDEPTSCLPLMKHRSPRPGVGVHAGQYRLCGRKVVIVVKKTQNEKKEQVHTRFRSRRRDNTESQEQTFHLELELRQVRSRRNFQLSWTRYSVSMRRDQWSHFEIKESKFPPLAFSRVKSYTAESFIQLPTAFS